MNKVSTFPCLTLGHGVPTHSTKFVSTMKILTVLEDWLRRGWGEGWLSGGDLCDLCGALCGGDLCGGDLCGDSTRWSFKCIKFHSLKIRYTCRDIRYVCREN